MLVTLMILFIAVVIPNPNQWNKRFFVAMFAIFVLFTIATFVDLLVYDEPNMALAEKIAAYFECLLISIPMPMFTAYLLHTCEENWLKSSLFRAVVILWGIYFIFLAIAQFTTFFYYVTPDNQYIRGSCYLLFVAPMFIVMFINLAVVIHKRDKLSSKYFAASIIHLISLQFTLTISGNSGKLLTNAQALWFCKCARTLFTTR